MVLYTGSEYEKLPRIENNNITIKGKNCIRAAKPVVS